MSTVGIFKDWDWPDIMRQTPGGLGIWEGTRFVLEPVEECDYILVLNNKLRECKQAIVPRENIWCIIQEPYHRGYSDWALEKHESFERVLTHHVPSNLPKYVLSPPSIPWHVNKSFDELTALDPLGREALERKKGISWVVGNANDLPGHKKRWAFLRFIQRTHLPVDLYGRAVHPLEDKWDGLFPYRYSLAVENSSSPHYWTEKVADCFLAWCVPIYYGCPNLENYFPKESFIRIDIERPSQAADRIRKALEQDSWEARIPYLKIARDRVLHRYQLFPHIAHLISAEGQSASPKQSVTIPAYRRSAKAFISHLEYKVRKRIHLL